MKTASRGGGDERSSPFLSPWTREGNNGESNRSGLETPDTEVALRLEFPFHFIKAAVGGTQGHH